MIKEKIRLHHTLLSISLLFSFLFHNSLEGKVAAQDSTTPSDIAIEVYPTAVSYNEHTVISINVPDEMNVAEVLLDTSNVGGPELTVDTELMEQTITIAEDTSAGKKNLPITITSENGEVTEAETQIEVLPREIKDETDFDWDEAVIYFLLTDRFKDGNPDNNNPNDEDYNLNHSETYHGGDLQGIIDELDYLQALGINTIWITPIVDNIDHNHRHGKVGAQYGYHGYWAKDFTQMDEHLGDLDTLKILIDEAHDRGIKLMVDVVLNHTGYGMKMADKGEGISNFPTADEQAVFEGMLREEPLQGHDVLGEIYGLPDFKSEEADVRRQIIDWQTEWVERARTDRGDTIDYFRVDTIKHMEDTTWNAFKNELTKIKPDFKLMGESWDATYNDTGGYLNTGQMDSLLDFDFKRIASMFAHGKIEQAEAELAKRNATIHNKATVSHFLSSHDEDGFLYYFMQGDEDLYKVAISLQLTAKGQPVIYYGEEIGVSGKAEGDMDQGEFSENRNDFDWDAVEGHHLVEHYQKLLASRKQHSKIFAKGDRQHVAGTNEEGFSIFSRSFNEDSVVIALNTTAEPIETIVAVDYEAGTQLFDEYNQRDYTVTDKSMIELSIPSYEDGGTVILAVQADVSLGESDNSSSQEVILLFIIVTAVGVIFFLWKKKHKVK